jgi:hypothetical protein
VFVSCVKSFDTEQRAVIKFYCKSGKTGTEAYQDLKNMYDDVRVVHKYSCVPTCFEEFSELPEDDPRPCQLVSARSNENVEKTRATVMQDR